MKYKKSMIILFIAIFLFSIAGACASDANATATATVNDHITDEINEIEANTTKTILIASIIVDIASVTLAAKSV